MSRDGRREPVRKYSSTIEPMLRRRRALLACICGAIRSGCVPRGPAWRRCGHRPIGSQRPRSEARVASRRRLFDFRHAVSDRRRKTTVILSRPSISCERRVTPPQAFRCWPSEASRSNERQVWLAAEPPESPRSAFSCLRRVCQAIVICALSPQLRRSFDTCEAVPYNDRRLRRGYGGTSPKRFARRRANI